MTLLLDTHAFIWAIASPHRLSATACDLIEDRGNRLLVTAASAWEIATTFRLGKLAAADAVVLSYDAHVVRLGADQLPVDSRHALRAGLFDVEHPDPFDRMLAAQALIEGLPLVTNDPAFRLFPGVADVVIDRVRSD